MRIDVRNGNDAVRTLLLNITHPIRIENLTIHLSKNRRETSRKATVEVEGK